MKKSPSKKVTKKALEAMPLHNDADVKRYIGFLNESHTDNLKGLGEGVVGINERLDRMDQRFEKIDQRFEKIDQRFEKIDQRFDTVDKKLDSHSEMIGRLLVDVEGINSGMKEKIDRTEFTKLEKRMVALEAFVFSGRGKQKTIK